jgi:G1/S-specific cyclin PLC1
MVSRPPAFTTRVWNEFLQSSVSPEMIRYLAQKVSNVVERNPNHNPVRPLDRISKVITASQYLDDTIPSLENFISSIVRQADIQVPILLTTLLYLSRLRSKLPPLAKGIRSTPHRIFLACLILSEKFLDDSSLCNKDWASYSQFEEFSLSNQEVNVMERQVLFLLDWDLNFQPSELEHHLEPFLISIRDSTTRTRRVTYRGNREVLNKRKPRGNFQSSNTNTNISKSTSERKSRQPLKTRRGVLINLPSPVVDYSQLCVLQQSNISAPGL